MHGLYYSNQIPGVKTRVVKLLLIVIEIVIVMTDLWSNSNSNSNRLLKIRE